MAQNDFKVTVGVDVEKFEVSVNDDIASLQKVLDKHPVKIVAKFDPGSVDDWKRAIDDQLRANNQNKLTATINAVFNTEHLQSSLDDATVKINRKKQKKYKLSVGTNVDFAVDNLQQSLSAAVRRLDAKPVIEVGVAIDPKSLDNVMNRISTTLDIELVPQSHGKFDIDAAKTERTAQLNDIETAFNRLSKVSKTASTSVKNNIAKITTELTNATTKQDIDKIVVKIQNLQSTIAALEQRTKSAFDFSNLRHEYKQLAQQIIDAGEQNTDYGKDILAFSKFLDKTSKKGNYEILHPSTLSRLQEAHDRVEELSQRCNVEITKLNRNADITLKNLLNQLTKAGVSSGNVVDEIVDLIHALQQVYHLSGLSIVTENQANLIRDIQERMETVSLTVQRILSHRNALKQMEYSGRQISSFNKLDKISQRYNTLEGLDISVDDNLRHTMEEIRDAIEIASSSEDFSAINKQIEQLDEALDVLERHTFDDKYRQKITSAIDEYQKMYRIVVETGNEQSHWGTALRNIISMLQQVFEYSDHHVFSDTDVHRVQNLVNGLSKCKDAFKEVFHQANPKKFKPFDYDATIKKVDDYQESLRKFGVTSGSVVDDLKRIKEEADKLKNDGLNGALTVDEQNRQRIEAIIQLLKDAGIHVANLKRTKGAEFFDVTLVNKFTKLQNDLRNFVADNSKVLTDPNFAAQYKQLTEATYWDFGGTKTGIAELEGAVERFKSQAKQAGLETKTFADRIKALVTSISLSHIIQDFGYEMINVFKDAIQNVRELDLAFTELKKVTNETTAGYEAFFGRAKKQAQEVGATLSDIVQSTADFARLGYSLDEATELSRVSTIYKNVGDGFESVTESSEALISIMKAFNIEAKDAITIADKLNKIGNENAISSGGLGRALQNSASALMEAGASMEEAMALITGANGVIQDPEQVGNGLRTIALRLRGTKVELEEMGEDATGAAESTSKLREQVMALAGVDIMKNANEYKGIYQILEEISHVWKDISDIDQAALLELLAGKNRSNILASLLNNFSDAKEALGDALNAEGSALKENEKILDSVQGKLNQFEAAWESLSNTVMNSDFLKNLIDLGTDFVTVLDKMISGLGALPSLIGVLGGIGGFAFVDEHGWTAEGWKRGKSEIESFMQNVGIELSGNDAAKTQKLQDTAQKRLDNDIEILKNLHTVLESIVWDDEENVQANMAGIGTVLNGISSEASHCAAEMMACGQNTDRAAETMKEFIANCITSINAIEGVTLATKAGRFAMSLLAGAVTDVIIAAVAAAASQFIDWLWNSVLTTNDAREAIEEYSAEIKELQSSESNVRALAARFEELSNKTNRSAEEQQEFYDVQNQLHDLMPELNGYYDAQNNFIINEVGGVQDLIKKYDDLIAKKHEAIATKYFDENFMGKSVYGENKDAMNRAQYIVDNLGEYKILYDKYYDEYSKADIWGQLAYSFDSGEKGRFWTLYNTTYDHQSPDQIQRDNEIIIDESIDSMRSALLSEILRDDDWKYVATDVQNAIIESLQGASQAQITRWSDRAQSNKGSSAFSIMTDIKSELPVYQEILDGRLDNLSSPARAAVVDLGGLEKANELLGEYRANQDAIQSRAAGWEGAVNQSNVAAVEAYAQWIETQLAAGDAISMLEAVGVEAVAGGEISTETYNKLKETFGECSEEWQLFEEKLAAVQNVDANKSFAETSQEIQEISAELDRLKDKKDAAARIDELRKELDLLTSSGAGEYIKQLEEEINKIGKDGGADLLDPRRKIDAALLNAKGWDAGEGYATVHSKTYGSNKEGWAINFTPIWVKPDGSTEVLTEEALDEYVDGILSGKHGDWKKLQIGAKFEGDDAVERAVSQAERLHYLHEDYFATEAEAAGNLEYAIDDLGKAYKNLGHAIDSVDSPNFSGLDDYQDKVNSASEALAEYIENQQIEHGTMAELQEVYGSCTEEWNEFVELLHSEDASVSTVTQKINKLVGAYLSSSSVLKNFNGSTKQVIASSLEQLGVTNALEVAEHKVAEELATQALASDEATESASTFNDYIETQAQLLGIDAVMAQKYADEILKINIQKEAETNFENTTAAETEQLIQMAVAAGWAGSNIDKLKRIQSNLAIMEGWDAKRNGDFNEFNKDITYKDDRAARQENEQLVKELQNSFDGTKITIPLEMDVSGLPAATDAAKKAAGDIEEAFQNMYDELQFMREANLISEAEYLARLAKLNEQYNKNNLALYRKYALEIFNGMKANMKENLTEQYDAQIEAYEEQIDALNEQKEETEKYYDDLIESEQEKLDLLKEEWETEEYLLKIEQARAALARAQQQKSVRTYREGQGFVWEQDQEAVHDAQTEVNEAIQEYNRYLQELAIEKQIEKLEKLKEAAIETIEEQIKALEKAKEAAQKAKEQALKDLEEMKFNGEMFLLFLEEAGIKIDEDLKKVIESFTDLSNMSSDELIALEDALGETEGSVEGFGETFQNVLFETGEDVEGFGGQVSNLQDTINNLKGKDIEIKVTTKYITEGTPSPYSEDVVITVTPPEPSSANKIAEQLPEDKLGINDVPAFASGVINLPRSVNALTDELGPELIIPGKGIFRKLKMGTSVLPADISRNLWAIGQNPIGFASGVASMISNKNESNKTYQVNVGDIVLNEVQNARRVADELKSLVLKAEQLAFSK